MIGKQIDKWLRRGFSRLGWMLVVYYLLMNLFAALGMGLDVAAQALWSFAAGDHSGTLDWDRVYGNAWGYVVTILVSFAVLHAWKGSGYIKRELLAKESAMRPAVFACVLCLAMGAQMVNSIWVGVLEAVLNGFGLSVIELLESVSGSSDTFSMFLYASILAPIAEEVLFRGYVLRTLRPFGKRFAIWGSAILFGLFHGNLLQTPYAILMGLLLGYVTVEYSLVWSVLLHMFNNLVLADLLTRLTMCWSDMAFSVLNMVLFGGAFAASIVLLVKKREEVRAYRRSEWMDRRVLKCFFTNPGILVLTGIALFNMISLLFA